MSSVILQPTKEREPATTSSGREGRPCRVPAGAPASGTSTSGFEKRNPGLHGEITQLGWNDYWTKLTAGFIAGTQPDVFTDHIQKFGRYAGLEVLQPLDGLGIEESDHQPGLAAAWTGQDGHRYGAPKDWDSVALFHNRTMAKDAGRPGPSSSRTTRRWSTSRRSCGPPSPPVPPRCTTGRGCHGSPTVRTTATRAATTSWSTTS
ncbi:hypothetical protein GCM10010129_03860 [Streptomyces fumigatiscleroticus]|nr:hypothetical protein GCM10010129_03860 [Streptomyces fumigatiscleroticus]